MSAIVWSDEQVVTQLNSGDRWWGDVITYAFPRYSVYMAAYDGERVGFVPLNSTQKAAAQLAIGVWSDLIVPKLTYTTSTNADIEYGYSTTGVEFAHAYMPESGSVWFKSNDQALNAPELGSYGFMAYVHETAHALGLDHMGDYNGEGDWTPSSYQDSTLYSVMSYFGPHSDGGEGDVGWADWVGGDGATYAPQTPMINGLNRHYIIDRKSVV